LVTEWDADEQLSAYNAVGDERAWQAAKANDVHAIAGHRLTDLLGENDVPPHWREAHEANARLLGSYMAELDRVASLLAASDIPLLALKNSGIARGIYSCIGCSPMGDMDVLVQRRHFRAAHQALLDDGYKFEFRSTLEEATDDAAEAGGGAEYWKMLPDGSKLWFELQWRPVAGRWIMPDQEPTAEEFIERSLPIPGTVVRLLDPTDNMLQVALHASKHSFVRAPGFRLNLDVDRISRYQEVDWDSLANRVERSGVKTAVYFALALPRALFNSPVPDAILQRLEPSRWKRRTMARWLERAGLFNPEERKFGNIGFLVFNALLYDDLGGFGRAVFPDRAWMRERYHVSNDFLLPVYHLRRLAGLAFRREL
jgi:hypothetical protein